MEKSEITAAAALLSSKGKEGRKRRWDRMTLEERSEFMRQASRARWDRIPFHAADLPLATVRAK